MIPSILDTIIFVESGKVSKVLTLKMTVKVPSGMTEADLARPVIEIKDFSTNTLEYEIYSYGEETVVVAVSSVASVSSPTRKLAEKQLEKEILHYTQKARVEIIGENKAAVYIPEQDMARIIGKNGRNIERIEKEIGIGIDVRPLQQQLKSIDFELINAKKYIILKTSPKFVSNLANIFIDDQLIFSAKISKKGEIKVRTKSELGRELRESMDKRIEMKI
jgi:ATPase